MKRTTSLALASVLWTFTARATPAEPEVDLSTAGIVEARPLRATAATGAFLPFSPSPVIEGQRAYGMGLGGYDTARETGSFEAMAEVRVWGPFALRVGAVYSNTAETLRPSVGGRAQVLHQGPHGIDGSVGVFYKPEGLTEPEGEIEGIFTIGKHLGGTYALASLAYGQDPEGNERDGEVRLGAVRPVGGRTFLGMDGRVRFDLGSQAAKLALRKEATFDVLVGPSVTVLAGPVALLVHGGASAVRFQGTDLRYGAFVLGGAGTAF